MRYILCQPAIKRFEWELEVCITRLHELGIRDIVLLFSQQDERVPSFFYEQYDVEVYVYLDRRKQKHYIPSIKPYLWSRYLKEDPSREQETYFYLDSDVLLRKEPESKPTDDVWYASDCPTYISPAYIDGIGKDLLGRMCEVIGIDETLIRENNASGGAQWLIKNPTYEYWNKVYEDSNVLYNFLNKIEPQYDPPIQKWTAEMWAQLWNVYHFGKDVQTPKELDFSVPTDDVDKYYQTNIYHNAGVVNDRQNMFFKGKYVHHTPFNETFHVDESKATIEYVRAIHQVNKRKEELNRMAKYEVLEDFRDLQENKEYRKGDTFPKPANKKIDAERLKELSTKNNNAGRPMIKKVKE